jgi:hypothetical protein
MQVGVSRRARKLIRVFERDWTLNMSGCNVSFNVFSSDDVKCVHFFSIGVGEALIAAHQALQHLLDPTLFTGLNCHV